MNKKPLVMQQVINPSGIGGVSAEFNALSGSKLVEKYDFCPAILEKCNKGINFQDIIFYYKKIKEIKPDIIHVRGAAVDGLNAVIAARIAGEAKVLVTVHGMYSDLVFTSIYKKILSRYLIEPLIFSMTDYISCLYEGAKLRPIFKRHKNKMIEHVYNRIPDYSKFNKTKISKEIRKKHLIDEESVVGIFVGRITKEKGVHILLQSLVNHENDWPKNLRLFIVGEGPYYNEFKEQVTKLRQANHVIFTGDVRNVHEYLLSSDFLIHPSLHENHSIAILEALAAGLACIVTDVGGNKETIKDDFHGIIVEKNDSEELYSAIYRLANSIKTLDTYKANVSGDTFFKFRDESIDAQLDLVYKRSLCGKGMNDER